MAQDKAEQTDSMAALIKTNQELVETNRQLVQALLASGEGASGASEQEPEERVSALAFGTARTTSPGACPLAARSFDTFLGAAALFVLLLLLLNPGNPYA